MLLELQRPLVCFDLETTGLDVQNDRLVEIGLVKISPDGNREQLQRRFDPGIDIPEATSKIHGIRTDDVRGLFGEPQLGKVGAELLAFIGSADLTGFNCANFDFPLWRNECLRHGLKFEMEGRLMVDVRTIFLIKEPNWDRYLQGPRNLNNAVLHYCGRDQAREFSKRDGDEEEEAMSARAIDDCQRHSAVKDADATLDVLLAQLRRYPDLPRDLPGLHEFCNQPRTAAR